MRAQITNEQFNQIEDLIQNSGLSTEKACDQVGIGKSTFYHKRSKMKAAVKPKRAYNRVAPPIKEPASPYTITTVTPHPKEDKITAVIGSPAVIAEFLKELLS